MKPEKIIEKHKSAIEKRWFDMVIDTYPRDTSVFLKREKNPFSNPVGEATIQGLNGLLNELGGDIDRKRVSTYLDPIIRIRAVQNFTASQAVNFVLFLKKIIRELAEKENTAASELLAFETKIDEISLAAFDIFMSCKETLYSLRANEVRNRTFKAFQRAGLIHEDAFTETGIPGVEGLNEARGNGGEAAVVDEKDPLGH